MHVLKKQVTHTLQWFPQYQPRSLYGRLWPNKRESGEVTAGRSRCVSPRSPTRLAVCQHSTSGSSLDFFALVFIFVYCPLSLTTDHQMSTWDQDLVHFGRTSEKLMLDTYLPSLAMFIKVHSENQNKHYQGEIIIVTLIAKIIINHQKKQHHWLVFVCMQQC